jgi:hypothetical protein
MIGNHIYKCLNSSNENFYHIEDYPDGLVPTPNDPK